MQALEAELLELAEAIDAQAGVFGMKKRPRAARLESALNWLRKELCPQKAKLIERATSSQAEIGMVICDVILFLLGNNLPGIPTLAKAIGQMGLEAFCADPTKLLSPSK